MTMRGKRYSEIQVGGGDPLEPKKREHFKTVRGNKTYREVRKLKIKNSWGSNQEIFAHCGGCHSREVVGRTAGRRGLRRGR